MNPRVKSVRPLDNFELEVSFENGESRRFDVKPYLGRGIFVRLRPPRACRRPPGLDYPRRTASWGLDRHRVRIVASGLRRGLRRAR